MNINLAISTPIQRSTQDDIDDNRGVVGVAVPPRLTGRSVLVPPDPPPMRGVYQVWHETMNDTWVWVDDEGIVHERECPIVTLNM